MSNKILGSDINRVDAVAKVTGKAKYTDDFIERDMLVGKVLRSPYAHAYVKNINVEEASKLDGVYAIITSKDLPRVKFATAGHPYSLDPGHRDVEDRLILTDKARLVGDAIAAVVAKDEIIADKALKLIKVDYEILPSVFVLEESVKENAPKIHEDRKNNIIASSVIDIGDIDNEFKNADFIFEGEYETSIVQHCQLENQTAYAYVDSNDRIVIVTSTQIPHIVRRVVGQALDIPWGRIRVIKPYVGGGFGNKQDVIIEPLTAAMTLAVNGRPVRFSLSREEVFIDTRTRHAMKFNIKSAVSKEGKLLGIYMDNIVNNGAYASHGHSIAMSAASKFRPLYNFNSIRVEPKTVYTNLPTAGAMRGYGIPQVCFALEAHIEDIAVKLNIDSIKFRKDNFISLGHTDPLSGIKVRSFELDKCIERGKELIKWDEKKELYKNQNSNKRKGLGMACFSYFSGTHPVALELAGARIVMNQDGSVQLQVGATEIGQGSDTVFSQMVAEVLGLDMKDVHIVTTQDTDITPFDTGAYASRQTFVTGAAVKKAAEEVKEKVLSIASKKFGLNVEELDIEDGNIIEKKLNDILCPLSEIAMYSYYDRINAKPITSDTSENVRINAVAYGVTFAEVEVDIESGKIEVLEIYNIHDSGKIMNYKLAEGQVQGGVSMGLGYALSEQMLFDKKTGKPLNNNLLDYKIQTILDTPKIGVDFVEEADPAGSFGQKSLGENPTISPAPAIRNAVLDATGVALNKLPMNPQSVFEKFREVGLV
ncbi:MULTISPECIES: xanthine dehydrogenase molybdenum-binding subunit XdhA [unclassified Clostridium]|uniref:xanthine dehydrogenase molybdenum-binding subunit XdhA n=1 Tax=unclassified Clostridium TaxID=2614128 RepID=UPI001C8B818E|nr:MULTISPECIES: xanthine dehydrogenase molybdenum-binding subunit XdhA [unclassified Clostridium]MBX9136105.1 xanthine dehydrogenase molybdenum-binding subunit XdhA [Clostridium sp. K12(2020)]MBX9143263.1 xanthine dehydrogenase molybdenum-binding subunit XdhA [Clostridium sp. K13]